MTAKSVFFAVGVLIAIASTVLYRKHFSFRKRATAPANTVEKNVEKKNKEPVFSTPPNLCIDDDDNFEDDPRRGEDDEPEEYESVDTHTRG